MMNVILNESVENEDDDD